MATPRTHLVYDDSNRNSYYGATYTPFPGWEGTQPKIWVVNPMHIITLTDATKSKIVRIVEIFKSFTEKWFSHILLLLFLLIYGCIGAWIFMTLEGNHESGQKVRAYFDSSPSIDFVLNSFAMGSKPFAIYERGLERTSTLLSTDTTNPRNIFCSESITA